MIHNIRGLYDQESISKGKKILFFLTPRIDVVMLHRLRGRIMEILRSRLMPRCKNWILEAAPCNRSWINPNVAGTKGMGILLFNKYAR